MYTKTSNCFFSVVLLLVVLLRAQNCSYKYVWTRRLRLHSVKNFRSDHLRSPNSWFQIRFQTVFGYIWVSCVKAEFSYNNQFLEIEIVFRCARCAKVKWINVWLNAKCPYKSDLNERVSDFLWHLHTQHLLSWKIEEKKERKKSNT